MIVSRKRLLLGLLAGVVTSVAFGLGGGVYWRRLEKIGVETEHEYLFEEVRNSVSRNTN